MMRRPPRWALVAAVLALAVAGRGGALAAASPAPSAAAPAPTAAMPYGEGRATECVVGGPVVALSVLPYLERAAAAALGGGRAEVDVPVLATGFAFGCGTGDVLSPGLWWMFRYL